MVTTPLWNANVSYTAKPWRIASSGTPGVPENSKMGVLVALECANSGAVTAVNDASSARPTVNSWDALPAQRHAGGHRPEAAHGTQAMRRYNGVTLASQPVRRLCLLTDTTDMAVRVHSGETDTRTATLSPPPITTHINTACSHLSKTVHAH